MDIQIEFISTNILTSKNGRSKIGFILENIKEDKILVLESPLTPGEEKELIEETMKQIDNKFPGIEISTLGMGTDDIRAKIIRMLGGKTGGLTVIGPSVLIKEIRKDPNVIYLSAGKKPYRRG